MLAGRCGNKGGVIVRILWAVNVTVGRSTRGVMGDELGAKGTCSLLGGAEDWSDA